MIVKLKMCTTGKIFRDVCSRNRLAMSEQEYIYIYIYIYIIWILLKTLSQKFGDIIKLVIYFYIYTWDCNVSWIYESKDYQVNMSYSLSAIFIPLLFYQPLPFSEKNIFCPIFWIINRTPIPIPFVNSPRSRYD